MKYFKNEDGNIYDENQKLIATKGNYSLDEKGDIKINEAAKGAMTDSSTNFEHSGLWRRFFVSFLDNIFGIIYIPTFVSIVTYFVKGQTLGCMVLGTMIVDYKTKLKADGGQLIGRFFAKILSMLPFGAGFYAAIYDPENRSWHDKLSGTCVVKTRDINPEGNKKEIKWWHYLLGIGAPVLSAIFVIFMLVTEVVPEIEGSLGGAQGRARDAARVADLNNVAAALSVYYDDNGQFPAGTECLDNSGSVGKELSLYLMYETVPNDPSLSSNSLLCPSSSGKYYYKSLQKGDLVNNAYVLCANMETLQKGNSNGNSIKGISKYEMAQSVVGISRGNTKGSLNDNMAGNLYCILRP